MKEENGEDAIDVLRATAPELANYLLRHRFHNDAVEAAEFLLEASALLFPNVGTNAAEARPSMLMRIANAKVETGVVRAAVAAAEEVGIEAAVVAVKEEAISAPVDALVDLVQVSCIQPRSKFDVSCRETSLRFVDKKGESFAVTKVRHVVVFPKPEDCRRATTATSASKPKSTGGDMVLLVLADDKTMAAAVSYKKKALKQVCLQLPVGGPPIRKNKNGTPDALPSDIRHDASAAWLRVLAASLRFDHEKVVRIYNPATGNGKNVFASHSGSATFTTVSGLPFVSCYHGVNDGVLFPLPAGLLFFKPPRFVPRDTLHLIDCTGGNRYLTLTAVTDAQEHIEFTNIHKQEQDVLHEYIHGTLIPAMQKDAAANTDDDDDDDDEVRVDEIVAQSHDDEHGGRVSGNRQKRKAAAAAAVVNKRAALLEHDGTDEDDAENDEDYADGAAGGEEDDDEGSSSDDDEEDVDNEEEDSEDDEGLAFEYAETESE